jgi:hypothetical protein
MTDMPDPFKGADTTLDENHLRHLDAINLIKATRDGDDAAAWEILALHSASKQDLENLVRSLSWVAVMLLDGMKKGRSDGDNMLAALRRYLLGDGGCNGHHDHGGEDPS